MVVHGHSVRRDRQCQFVHCRRHMPRERHQPSRVLDLLYEQLPRATTLTELEALLPWNVKPLLKARSAP